MHTRAVVPNLLRERDPPPPRRRVGRAEQLVRDEQAVDRGRIGGSLRTSTRLQCGCSFSRADSVHGSVLVLNKPSPLPGQEGH
jgi:hypothetical protein